MLSEWMDEFQVAVNSNLNNEFLARTSTRDLMGIFSKTPFKFDPSVPMVDFNTVVGRGYAACGEAAAALAVTEFYAGKRPTVCVKINNLTNGAHAIIISDGRILDPYEKTFKEGGAYLGCFKSFKPIFTV